MEQLVDELRDALDSMYDYIYDGGGPSRWHDLLPGVFPKYPSTRKWVSIDVTLEHLHIDLLGGTTIDLSREEAQLLLQRHQQYYARVKKVLHSICWDEGCNIGVVVRRYLWVLLNPVSCLFGNELLHRKIAGALYEVSHGIEG